MKGVNKAEAFQAKHSKQDDNATQDKKGPAGGFDSTPVPQAPAGYTVKFTFHRATALPFADINTLSSDPYVLAELMTDLKPRHKQDPPLRHRTRTIRRNVNPEWNEEWIVANVPVSGFRLKCRIFDEDPANHDDRLGNVHVVVPSLKEGFENIQQQEHKIKKASGSKRAYFIRGCAALFSSNTPLSGNLVISVELLGRTEAKSGGHMYTVGPCRWIKHFSPMIGRLAGTKDAEATDEKGNKINKYNFQANQMQLRGPVPDELYHRYVEFKPFVKGMFTGLGLRGKVLNRALHHQHARIYNFDRTTKYGEFPEPSEEMTKKFLDLVHYDLEGRIFTYVLSLDGLWRFTETGKEFGIDLLSKHTMHSDVSIYIAFSGEFFIRRLKNPRQDAEKTETHPPNDIGEGPPESAPPKDPAHYQLYIDNDSGTYRPNKDLLPLLKEFMSHSLPGLKITTLDCQGDEEKMQKLKSEQRERKKKEGQNIVYNQLSDDSSVSSSDEEELDEAAAATSGQPRPDRKTKLRKEWAEKQEKARDLRHGKDAAAADDGGVGPSSEEPAHGMSSEAGPSTQTSHAGPSSAPDGASTAQEKQHAAPAGAESSWAQETTDRIMGSSGEGSGTKSDPVLSG